MSQTRRAFFLGLVLGVVLLLGWQNLTSTEPFDIAVYRTDRFELWVQGEMYSPLIPMSHFEYRVKWRKICLASGNLCSEWKLIGKFQLDAPYRASDLKFDTQGEGGRLSLPEGYTLHSIDGESWEASRSPN